MELKIGLQLWSVRNGLNKDFAGTLEKIAEIGYTDLQINASKLTPDGMIFGQDIRAAEVRKYLDKFGLRAPSVHFVPTPDMDLDAIIEDLKILGADSIACAVWFWSSKQEVLDWMAQFNKYGEKLKKSGIQLDYHNHFHEFQVFESKSIFEMALDSLDKDLIKFEFDTYWAVRGGQDPIYWMKKLGTRCDLIHQKDMPETTKPVILFYKTGYDANITMDTLWKSLDASHFTEVGDGILDIPGYIRAARQYNQAKYIFIEQDMTSKTELESIAVNFQRMNKLMSEN